MRNRVVVAAAMLVAALGCGSKSETRESGALGAESPSKPRIALVMKSLANEFFLTMEEGAQAHQAAHATEYELIANGIKDEQDLNQQIQIVEQMVGMGVDAIVIAPADSKALIPACIRAQEAGIVVVNIDNRLDAEILKERGVSIPFVGPDNRAGARAVGEYLAKHLNPGDPVVILEGIPTAFNAQQRKSGFDDAMNAAGMRIVDSQSAAWETSKAHQIASAILLEHPETRAILCANDSMALGAVAALRDSGRQGDTFVVGFDNISAIGALLEEGKVLATADQHADQLAVFGIEAALDIIREGTAPADRETPVDLVTASAPQAAE